VTITFTDEARAHLDRYLRQMRSALSRQLSVDVSDVERDIVSHIDAGDWFRQRHALWLTIAGLLGAAASGAMLFRILV
jgi:hypothetical protein